jgi:hypothetical protein
MFDKIFKYSLDKEFVAKLVKKLNDDVPPNLLGGGGKVLTVNRVTKLLERTFQAASSYQIEQRMGFIRRTVMVNNFKWALKEAGYSDEFVAAATEGLVMAFVKR